MRLHERAACCQLERGDASVVFQKWNTITAQCRPGSCSVGRAMLLPSAMLQRPCAACLLSAQQADTRGPSCHPLDMSYRTLQRQLVPGERLAHLSSWETPGQVQQTAGSLSDNHARRLAAYLPPCPAALDNPAGASACMERSRAASRHGCTGVGSALKAKQG